MLNHESQLFAKKDPHRVSQNVRRYRTHNASLGERTPLSSGLRTPNFNFYVELGNYLHAAPHDKMPSLRCTPRFRVGGSAAKTASRPFRCNKNFPNRWSWRRDRARQRCPSPPITTAQALFAIDFLDLISSSSMRDVIVGSHTCTHQEFTKFGFIPDIARCG